MEDTRVASLFDDMPQRIALELQALVAETRRKYPDVRQSADHLLAQWQADADRTVSELQSCKDPSSHALLQMIVLACETRSPKVIQLALSLLQSSIPLRILPDTSLATVIDTLHTLLSAPGRTDVDVQLKILQIVSSLLVTYANVTSELLSRALMLCFTLYEHSRVVVVSSTAAAMLRQNVMVVFEKVQSEDQSFDAIQNEDAAVNAPLPVGTAELPSGPVTLFPCAADVYHLLNDLCALADGQPAQFLPLDTLSKPFVLELLESVLTTQSSLFQRHPELVYILRSAACPFLLKALSKPPASFSVYIRVMRLVALLLCEYHKEIVLEVEMLLRALLDTLDEKHALWQRVLAWETMRSLSADSAFLTFLWDQFDGQADPICVLGRLVECVQQFSRRLRSTLVVDDALAAALEQRPDVPHTPTMHSTHTMYDVAMAGMRSAAEGLLSSKAEMLVETSEPHVPLLDQLDKTDAPVPGSSALPTTYLPCLVLQSLVRLSHNLAEAQQAAIFAAYTRPINEGLTVFLTVQGADLFFEQTLDALVHMACAAGVAQCATERDLILATLCDLAVPSAAYSGQALGTRNLGAQAALAYVCASLGQHLGSRWRALLQCVCQALVCLRKGDDETVHTPAETLRWPDDKPSWLAPSTIESLGRLLRGVFVSAANLDHEGMDTFAGIFTQLIVDRSRGTHDATSHMMLIEWERFVRAAAPRIVERMPEGPWSSMHVLMRLLWDERMTPVRRIDIAQVCDACIYTLWCTPLMDNGEQPQEMLRALARQGILERRTGSTDVSVRNAALSTLHRILESQVHMLRRTSYGWEHVFAMCEAAAKDASAIRASGAAPMPLLRTAFACMQSVCASYLPMLNDADLVLCINALPSFSMQTEDVAMALQANGTLWDLTESIERRDREQAVELWLVLLQRLRDVAQVPKTNMAECALANLFQVLLQYHLSFRAEDWIRVLSDVLLPLVEGEHAPARAFHGTARVVAMVPALRTDPAWPAMWARWLHAMEETVAREPSDDVMRVMLEALHSVLRLQDDTQAWWHEAWPTVLRLCDTQTRMSMPDLGLLADMLYMLFVKRSRVDESASMLHALHSCMRRGLSVADALSLSHLRELVRHVQASFDFLATQTTVRPKVLDELVRCTDMAYAASLHAKHVRMQALYTELTGEWMAQWLRILEQEAGTPDACLASMLRVLVRPLKACPEPGVPSAWCVVCRALVRIAEYGTEVETEEYWHTLFDAMATAMCADAHSMPTDEEDACALHLLACLEHVLPKAGAQQAAQPALTQFLPRALEATHLYAAWGTLTQPCQPTPRERMVYETWHVLFRQCSSTSAPGAKAIAVRLLPMIVERCQCILQAFVDDARIRGSIPLPRVRVEEANFLLRALLTLRAPTHVYQGHAYAADAHLFVMGHVLDDIATARADACLQIAHVGTSLPPIPPAIPANSPDTCPQALAAAGVARRTALLT